MLTGMERATLENWIEQYERLWRTAGTDGLAELFAADATYLPAPWREPITGLAALAAFWDEERDGPDERFTLTSEVVAVEGDVGVARVEVSYDEGERWRDLWAVRLDNDRRCTAFEEWPFSPAQGDGHD
jgi:ketosteroid isomerase-like protein